MCKLGWWGPREWWGALIAAVLVVAVASCQSPQFTRLEVLASSGGMGGQWSGGTGGGAGAIAGSGGAGGSAVGATGGAGGSTDRGGSPAIGGAGTGGAGTGGAMTGPGKYDFEDSTQLWASRSPQGMPSFSSVAISPAQHFSGVSSLAGTITATTFGLYQLGVAPMPPIAPGATITFHVFFPASSAIDWVQPFALGIEVGNPPAGAWTGVGVPTANLKAAEWNTMTVTVPAGSVGIAAIGVEFHLGGAWSGTVYVDDVSW